ncbi:UNVERIFIED_CONTAM: Zinc finger CCCH domain-containing protein 48 [Sesamum angustifolium]|uniref:Zinc finger CCCH domain-containing protein 48 n=1 Tax=Sesamum angustifolium TaxID=2727405 RepID=A0AAW2KDL4_9LAMI
MAVKAATRVSIFDRVGGQPVKTQVCTYWLAGRCNRNPCRFMHRELPPPQSRETQLAPPKNVCGMQSRKMTWRSPNYNNPGTATLSSDKGGMHSSINGQSSRQNILANTANENVRMDQEMTITSLGTHAVRTEPENCSSQKAKPKQCKYWVTGNCVHGDKCKDLHSWCSGSGFTLLKKLEGHTKVSLTYKSFDTIFLRLLLGFPFHLAPTSYIHVARINPFELGTATLCAGSIITDGEAGCLISEGSWLFVGLQTALKAWNLQHHAEFGFGLLAGLVCSMVLDDDKLFAGMEDGSILVWKLNLETLTVEAAEMLKGHHGTVTSLVGCGTAKSAVFAYTISAHKRCNGHHLLDNYLLSASLDNTLKIWAATESGTIDVIHEIKEDCDFIALLASMMLKPSLFCSAHVTTTLSACMTCPREYHHRPNIISANIFYSSLPTV